MRGSVFLFAVTVGWLALGTGCSRERYRQRADRDVSGILTQKNVVPNAPIENWHVYPDERARYADPTSPDRPPMPPDDEYARMLSPNPQRPGRAGIARVEGDGYMNEIIAWDARNRAEAQPEVAAVAVVEPAVDPTAVALKSDQKAYRLKLDQAVELAIFNSREFQDRREDLYLAALPVSLERFQFSAQAFASEQIIREYAGVDRPDAGNRWRVSTEAGFTRKFATGAELLVRLANQVVIDLSGGKPTISVSTLGLALVQPLLRGGGLAVTLEALTQAERTMLYAVRSYARFRSNFYVAIAGNGNYTNNPYGLQGLSQNLGRGIGANLTSNPAGYLPTLLRAAILANEKKNITSVEQFLKLFENLKEGGGVPELQVVRVEQRLLQSRALVLTRTQQYVDGIDNFKLQLGIPATVPLELDDTPLKPIRMQLKRFEEVYDQLRELELAAGQFDPKEPVADLRARWLKQLTETKLVKGTQLAKDYPKLATDLKAAPADELAKRTSELLELRRKLLDAKAERQSKRLPESEAELSKLSRIEAEFDRINFELALRRYETQPWMKAPPEKRVVEQAVAFRVVVEAGLLVAIQARNQRLDGIRGEWPTVPQLLVDDTNLMEISLDEAYLKIAQVALNNRLDLMNARAQVVDAWRQIAIRVNALQGVFDVRYDLTANSPFGGNDGLNFTASRVLHQVTMRIEPPFVRRAERNLYRAALISYQRQRRNLQAFEDSIVTDARVDLRALRQLYQTFLVQQRAVELAYSQVDNARSTFLAPPDPKTQDTAGNVAALTQQLLEAQGALVQAQNDLSTTWVNYLTARMDLYLDLELLPLDSRGLWPDDSATAPGPAPRSGSPDADPVGPERLPAPAPLPPGPRSGGAFEPIVLPAPGDSR